MPKYVAADTAYTHHVDFIVDQELVTPSAATYTIRDNTGAVVESLEDIAITLATGATTAELALASTVNAKTLEYEVRYVETTFTYDSAVYIINDFYVIRDDLRFPLTPDEVRAVLGLSDFEVTEVDIFHAYGLVEDEATGVTIASVVSGGTDKLTHLIDAVKYKAAWLICHGIQGKMLQTEQSDNSLYRRFEDVDFAALKQEIQGLYSASLRKVTGATSATLPVLTILSADTDAITG